jgi:hypothetical protein
MKNKDSTDSYNTLLNKGSVLPTEIQWVETILDEIQFANSILIRFRIDVKINLFCARQEECSDSNGRLHFCHLKTLV